VGLLLAYFSSTWIAASLGQAVSSDWHFHVETRPDWAVLLVTVAGSVIATVLFGAYPAWRVTRLDLFNVLKKGAGDLALGGRKGGTLLSTRGLMIMAQIALSFVMLTSGALFLKATIAAAQSTPGFPLEGSLLVELDPDLVGYDETRAREIYSTV